MSRDLHHLAAAYAVDALDEQERRDFEAHYPSCEICSQEVVEFRETAAALAGGLASSPPVDLKSSVMAEIAVTRQLPPAVTSLTEARPARRNQWVLAAAAGLLLVGGLFGALIFGSSDTDPVTELVAAPDSLVTTLEGSQGALQIVYSDARDQVAVLGSGLAELGENQAYALWFLVDDGVAPAGLFQPENGAIRQVFEVDDVPTNGWGITIEPDTGSAQPTSEVIYAGTF